ncbi:MAG TPA: hypothetical protein VJP77_06495, partial [Planctomycetota bacterium]|nr:hypothetical protein [Planctomycetota bacterium]
LRGVDLLGQSAASPAALVVEQCSGTVWVEDCVVGPQSNGVGSRDGARVTDAAAVVFERCLLRGSGYVFLADLPGAGGEGLRVDTASVAVHDSDALGSNGSPYFPLTGEGPFPGGAGMSVEDGVLFVSGGTAQGGSGGHGGFDFVFGFCIGPNGGGPGVHVRNPSSVFRHVGGTFTGGTGGVAFVALCPGEDAPDGLPIQNGGGLVVALPGAPHALSIPSPLRGGETLLATLGGEPGELAVLALSLGAAPLYTPGLGEVLVAQPPLLFTAGLVDASGVATKSFAVPVLGPPFEALALVWQGAFLDPQGGVATGAGSVVTVLDPAL